MNYLLSLLQIITISCFLFPVQSFAGCDVINQHYNFLDMITGKITDDLFQCIEEVMENTPDFKTSFNHSIPTGATSPVSAEVPATIYVTPILSRDDRGNGTTHPMLDNFNDVISFRNGTNPPKAGSSWDFTKLLYVPFQKKVSNNFDPAASSEVWNLTSNPYSMAVNASKGRLGHVCHTHGVPRILTKGKTLNQLMGLLLGIFIFRPYRFSAENRLSIN